jgi:DNA-binding MarR family transcriptional regulator
LKAFTRISNHLIRDATLSPNEFRILAILMSLNPCHPSYADLCDWSSLSRATLHRTLKTLNQKGLISWKAGFVGRNNQYQIHTT